MVAGPVRRAVLRLDLCVYAIDGQPLVMHVLNKLLFRCLGS